MMNSGRHSAPDDGQYLTGGAHSMAPACFALFRLPSSAEIEAYWELCRLHNNIGFWVVYLPTGSYPCQAMSYCSSLIVAFLQPKYGRFSWHTIGILEYPLLLWHTKRPNTSLCALV